MKALKWTKARLDGAAVLRAAGGYARESNSTDLDRQYVYWQTRQWLSAEGLVEPAATPTHLGDVRPGDWYVLTESGRKAMAELVAEGRLR